MRKGLFSVLTVIISGALLLSACSSPASTPTADSGKTEAGAATSEQTTTPAAGGITSLVKATDLAKLPENAKKRTDTIIVGLTDPSGAFTPFFHQSGYDGNVCSLFLAGESG